MPYTVPSGIPILVAVDSDHVLGGVQEMFAAVRPRPGAGSRVGVKLYPEIQALPFFDISLDGTGATQHGKKSLFWRETKEVFKKKKSEPFPRVFKIPVGETFRC